MALPGVALAQVREPAIPKGQEADPVITQLWVDIGRKPAAANGVTDLA
jgi:hypothetical protein